ncbi:phosphopantetheine-binding protein [Pantoea sp. 18069]|uniref:phosphopantetheine-binding protein n=1 Tax=Pantoea sp. 18069 TaxID=2681415 RepID=UPI00135A7DB5|nr:phosphopantetheine-binding protein [Pantoea sp. 18069]
MTTTPSKPPFTLERMRADIARVVSLSPDEIELDDNLMDCGLDSMRLLMLVMDWNQAGLALDMSELGEHTTLNDWWSLVQKQQGQA